MSWEIVPQDEVWVKQAKRNLTALYENQPLARMPFEWGEFRAADEFESEPVKEGSAGCPHGGVEEARQNVLDMESVLREQLKNVAKRVRGGFWDDRILSLHPLGAVTCWLPEVFGANVRWFVNRPCFTEPLINEVRQVDALRPDFGRAELYQHGLKQMRFFRDVVGDRIPVTAPDLQSPVDVASMIMDYTSLIYAMMDEPARVHALLRMITDATISAWSAFRHEMVTDYPMTQFDWWMPRGIFMSDDVMAVLSPELYREFAVPYNEDLAEEFGGLGLHSCGRILHNLENVARTKGILALNTQDPLCDAAPLAKNGLALIVGGIFEAVMATHPDSKRVFIEDPESLEKFWWEDSGRMAEIKRQRFLYQHHALLHTHTATEAYERILLLSERAVEGLQGAAVRESNND